MFGKLVVALVLLACLAPAAGAQTSTTVKVHEDGSAEFVMDVVNISENSSVFGSTNLVTEEHDNRFGITASWDWRHVYLTPKPILPDLLPENSSISYSVDWYLENDTVELEIAGLENAQAIADDLGRILASLTGGGYISLIDESVEDGRVRANFTTTIGWGHLLAPLGELPLLALSGSGSGTRSKDNDTISGNSDMEVSNLRQLFSKFKPKFVRVDVVNVRSLRFSENGGGTTVYQRVEVVLDNFARKDDDMWVIVDSLTPSFQLEENETFGIELPSNLGAVDYSGNPSRIEGTRYIWEGPAVVENVGFAYALGPRVPIAVLAFVVVFCAGIVILALFRKRLFG